MMPPAEQFFDVQQELSPQEKTSMIYNLAFSPQDAEATLVANRELRQGLGDMWIREILARVNSTSEAYYAIETIGSNIQTNELVQLSEFFTSDELLYRKERGAREALPEYFSNPAKLQNLTEDDRQTIIANIKKAIENFTNVTAEIRSEEGLTHWVNLWQTDIFKYTKICTKLIQGSNSYDQSELLSYLSGLSITSEIAFDDHLTSQIQILIDSVRQGENISTHIFEPRYNLPNHDTDPDRYDDLDYFGHDGGDNSDYYYHNDNDEDEDEDEDEDSDKDDIPFKEFKRITKESVQRILEGSATKSEIEPWISEGLYYFINEKCLENAEKFYQILANRSGTEKAFSESEISFLNAAHEELGGLDPDIDPRIIKSQLSAFHSLIFSGGLNRLYQEYLTQNKDQQSPENEKEIEIKTEIAFAFLTRVAEINKEEKYAEVPSGYISVGIEIEYHNFIHQEMATKKIYEDLVVEYDKILSTLTLEKTFFNRKKFAAQKKQKLHIQKLKDKTQRRLDILNSIIGSQSPESVAQNFNTWEPGTQASLALDIVSGSSNSEIQSKPSANYKTQLREIISISQVGGLRDNWGIHETFGGIELSPEHTEFMDALPIAIAAGFVQFETKNEMLWNNPDLGYSMFVEKYSKDDDDGNYFPYHKPRSSYFFKYNDYAGRKQKSGVELRSLPEYTANTFIKFVRQISFHFYFAHGVKSFQKPESERVEQDQDLKKSYEELMVSWESLLAEHNLELPSNKDKCIQGRVVEMGNDFSDSEENESQKALSTNKYLVFIGKMAQLEKDDKDFSKKTRELVRIYNGKIKRILDQK